ncbi:MAG: hypothetical protein U5K72_02100 [Balneolaceae bacterium]|nr:hypothetical protein [Balneolaceae bacterium]
MGVQKTSTEDIKKWESPTIIELDISDTKFGEQGDDDGDGFGEGDINPPPRS